MATKETKKGTDAKGESPLKSVPSATAKKSGDKGPSTPETANPQTAPSDKAEGKPKIEEGAPSTEKIAGGGGSNVYKDAPLIEGIPVVVPINQGHKTDAKLVFGVALAAPVVEGVPEMIANAQAEASVDEAAVLNPGDIRSIHDNGNGEVQVDVVNDDGVVEAQRHNVDAKLYKEFEKSFEGGKQSSFFKGNFSKSTRVQSERDAL